MASSHPTRDHNGVSPPDTNGAGLPGPGAADEGLQGVKRRLHEHLLSAVTAELPQTLDENQVRGKLGRLADEVLGQHPEWQGIVERETLVAQVLDEVFGFGPLEALMRDHEVSDILINGPRQLFVEKRGQLQPTKVTFRDEEHLTQVLQRMVASTGRRIDAQSPMVDPGCPTAAASTPSSSRRR